MNKRKILSGSTVDIFGSIINAIFSFLILRSYFSVITKEEYGLWLALFGVASLVGLVNIGIDQYFLTIIPNDKKFYNSQFNVELSNFIVVKFCIVFVFFVLGLILFFFLNKILIIPPNYAHISSNVYLISLLVLLLNIISSTLSTILIGRGHYSLNSIILNLGLFSSNVLSLLLLNLNFRILSFPLSLLIVSLIQFAILLIIVLNKYSHLKLDKPCFSGKREMLNYSFSFQVLNWANLIRSQILNILLNNLVGPSSVTIFNVTNRIPQIIPVYMNKLIAPLFPTYAALVFENEEKRVKLVLLTVIKFLFRFSLFFVIGIILFNSLFIELWVGGDKFGGWSLNILLSIYSLIMSSFCGFGMIIYATKKFEKWPLISFLEIIITLIVCSFWGAKYGILGVFSGFLITSLVSQIYLAYISLKQVSIVVSEIFFETFNFILMPNILSLLLGVIYINVFEQSSWLVLIVGILLYSIAHFSYRELPILFLKNEITLKERLKLIIAI